MLLVGFLLHLAFVTVPASVIFEDCGSAYELQSVNIEGCSRRLPCHLTLGDEVPVSVQFYANFASSQLDHDVVININLINLSTEVTPDPCHVMDCPVRTNAATSFTSVMTVPTQMALNQRGYLRWRVYNESNRLVLCYSVLVQTQSRLQRLLREILKHITPDADDIVDSVYSETSNLDPATLSDPSLNFTQGYLQELIEQYHKKISVDVESYHQ